MFFSFVREIPKAFRSVRNLCTFFFTFDAASVTHSEGHSWQRDDATDGSHVADVGVAVPQHNVAECSLGL